MPVYDYRALAHDGRHEKGLMTADHAIDLGQQLQSLGLVMLKAREISPLQRRLRIEPNVSGRERGQLFAAFARIFETGSPLLPSLQALAESLSNRTTRAALLDVTRQLARGRPLSMGLGQHRKVFGAVSVALVNAGERTGRLDIACRQCQAHAQWQDETTRRVAQALTYPVLLVLLSMAVLSFMMTWLAPRVLEFLATMRHAPGVLTIALIDSASFAQVHWRDMAFAALAALAALALARQLWPAFGRALDRGLLRLPLVGRLARCSEAGRFAHFMAVGLASGLNAQRAFDIAATLIGNRALRDAVERAALRIVEGQPLTQALAGTGLFDAQTLQSLRSAALTDGLGEAFETASRHAEQDAEQLGARVVAIVPPVMIVFVGVVLAWILAALFLPIYATVGLESYL